MDNKFVVIIDYGMGNIGSVKNALDYLKFENVISSNRTIITKATHIILPGVGAFGEGIKKLKEKNIIGILNKAILDNKKPFLGICLGMQLLAEIGEEGGTHKGLGWIKGRTRRIKVDEKKYHLPHIGWNDVNTTKKATLFNQTEPYAFYFVHTYCLEPTDKKVVSATCDYGEIIVASVEKNNIFGVQFHPERSQRSGLKLLENFLNFNS